MADFQQDTELEDQRAQALDQAYGEELSGEEHSTNEGNFHRVDHQQQFPQEPRVARSHEKSHEG